MFEKLNKEFWVGQIFTLFATIVGVYLAANSGFEKALEFETLQHQRNVYYMKQSLLSEVQGNITNLEVWAKKYKEAPRDHGMEHEKARYQVDLFLWETVQEGDIVFEIPYAQTQRISHFYREASLLLSNITSGNPFEISSANRLLALTDEIKKTFIPALSKELDKQKAELTELGVLGQ